MRKFVDSTYFTTIITMVCVLAAVVVGLETDNELMANEKNKSFVNTLDVVVLVIFGRPSPNHKQPQTTATRS